MRDERSRCLGQSSFWNLNLEARYLIESVAAHISRNSVVSLSSSRTAHLGVADPVSGVSARPLHTADFVAPHTNHKVGYAACVRRT